MILRINLLRSQKFHLILYHISFNLLIWCQQTKSRLHYNFSSISLVDLFRLHQFKGFKNGFILFRWIIRFGRLFRIDHENLGYFDFFFEIFRTFFIAFLFAERPDECKSLFGFQIPYFLWAHTFKPFFYVPRQLRSTIIFTGRNNDVIIKNSLLKKLYERLKFIRCNVRIKYFCRHNFSSGRINNNNVQPSKITTFIRLNFTWKVVHFNSSYIGTFKPRRYSLNYQCFLTWLSRHFSLFHKNWIYFIFH